MIKRFISMAAAISFMASVCPVRLAYAQEVTVDFHSGENIALGKSTSTSYLPGWQYWYTSAGGYPGDTSGGAENNYITDGDINTKNSPRNNPIDYIIDLGQVYTISEIALYGICKNLTGTSYISLGISKDSMTESAAVVTEIQGLSDGTEVNSSINTVLSLSVSKEKARYIKLRGPGASSFAMYETFIKGFVIESLQKPSAPAWNGHTLLWSSVAHADSYNVNLYLNNKLFETVCTDTTSINFDNSLLYAGDYMADVAADSNADQYSASDFSDKSAPLSVQNIEIENNRLVKNNIALNKGVELEGAYKASYGMADFITDGFVTTSCSSDTAVSGTRYAVIDLENVYSIDDVVLYTDRTEKDIEYDVFTSFDGKNFDKVSLFAEYAPADNGGGSYYKIIGSIAANTKAKYIKIAGNADKLFQLSEVVIYGAESDTEILSGSIAQNKQVFCADGNVFWENIELLVDGDITTQAKCATGGSFTVDLAAAYYLSEIALYTGLSETDSVISVYGSNEQSNLKKTFLGVASLKGAAKVNGEPAAIKFTCGGVTNMSAYRYITVEIDRGDNGVTVNEILVRGTMMSQLDTPQNVVWSDRQLMWDAVADATSYTVTFYRDGKRILSKSTEEQSFNVVSVLQELNLINTGCTMSASVTATAPNFIASNESALAEATFAPNKNIALSKVVITTSALAWYENDKNSKTHVTDGDYSTSVYSRSTMNDEYKKTYDQLTIDLDYPHSVTKVRVYMKKGANATLDIYASNDKNDLMANLIGTTTPKGDVTIGGTTISLTEGEFTVPENGAQYITVRAQKPGTGYTVHEIEIFGEKVNMKGHLDKPDVPYWDGKIAKWAVVENATQYSAGLYINGRLIKTVLASENKYDFSSEVYGYGAYTVRVTASAPGSLWESSEASDMGDVYLIDKGIIAKNSLQTTLSGYNSDKINYSLEMMFDGNYDTYYKSDSSTPYTFTVQLHDPAWVDKIVFNELGSMGVIGNLSVSVSATGVDYDTVYNKASSSNGRTEVKISKEISFLKVKVSNINADAAGFSEVEIFADLNDGQEEGGNTLNLLGIKSVYYDGEQLPEKDALGNHISWSVSESGLLDISDNKAYIKSQAYDTAVVLTATVTTDGKTYSRKYRIIVSGLEARRPNISNGSSGISIDSGFEMSGQTVQATDRETASKEIPAELQHEIKGHWAEKEIGLLIKKGVVTGDQDSLHLNRAITRAEFALMVSKSIGLKDRSTAEKYKDVSETDWYYDCIQLISSAGIMTGFGGYMRPNDKITREEMAKVICAVTDLLGLDTDTGNAVEFTDYDDISDWAKESVTGASRAGILNGFEDNTFRPLENVLREQAMVVCYRLSAGMPDEGNISIKNGKMSFEVISFGIVTPDEEGKYNLDEKITRGRFAEILTKLTRAEDIMDDTDRFDDVERESKYFYSINYVIGMEYMTPYGERIFEPDGTVSTQEAVAALLRILGYPDSIRTENDITMARALGLMDDLPITNALTLNNVIQLVHNALDIDRVAYLGNGNTAKVERLRSLFANSNDDAIYNVTGIVTANYDSYMYKAKPLISENQVEIDGVLYDTGKTDVGKYFGMSVSVYVKDTKDSRPQILSVAQTNKNSIAVVRADKVHGITNGKLEYETDTRARNKSFNIASGVCIIKNGRPMNYYDEEALLFSKGSLRLIDNDGDLIYDVIIIDDYVNVMVDKVNGNNIELDSRSLYKGTRFINIAIKEDIHNSFFDAVGNRIECSDIQEKSVLSISVDDSETVYKYVMSTQTIEGIVDSVSDDNILISGVEYPVYSGDTLNVAVSNEVKVYFDSCGYAVYADVVDTGSQCGYVVSWYNEEYSESEYIIKLVKGSPIEYVYNKNVDNLDDNNLIPKLICKNSGVLKLKIDSNTKINGEKFGGKMTKLHEGIYEYTLRDDGIVKELKSPQLAGGGTELKYNVYDKVFGGNLNATPFAIDSNTQVLCVPKGQVESDDDYIVPLEISAVNSLITYDVLGYDFDNSTKCVKYIVFKQIMRQSDIPEIKKNSASFAVIMKTANESIDNEDCLRVNMMTGSGERSETIQQDGYSYEYWRDLKKGDIIYFSNTFDNKLGRAFKAASADNCDYIGFVKNEGAEDEQYYGRVIDIEYDEINAETYSKVTRLTMDCGGVMRHVDIPQRNTPPVIKVLDKGRYTEISSLKEISICNDYLFVLTNYGKITGCVLFPR